MDPVALFTTSEGRLAQKPFWLALLAVYLASFASQFLLTGPVILRSGVWPFVVVQAGLLWAWTVVHIKRLRDAGRPPGGAIAMAILYAATIGVALLIAAVLFVPSSEGSWQAFWAAALLIALFAFLLDPNFGPFFTLFKALALLALLPFLLSLTFSLYTGFRRRRDGRPAARAASGVSARMTLYFAYGANMERAGMRKRCPGAVALGPARLRGWRYIIASGYGSVAPAQGCEVHGVLWRLTPRATSRR